MIQLKGPSVAYVALFLACILSGPSALGQDMDGYQMARWDPLHF